MDLLYDWVKDIAFYMILMTVVLNVVPNNNYHKYIKLFTGMIMIIIVVSPIMGFWGLNDSLERYFKNISFTEEARELKPLLEEADNKRFQAIISEYKSGIEREMGIQAESFGLILKKADIVLCDDINDEDFGTIVTTVLIVGNEDEKPPIYVEPVKIMEQDNPENSETASTAETARLKEQLLKDYNLKEEQLQIYFNE